MLCDETASYREFHDQFRYSPEREFLGSVLLRRTLFRAAPALGMTVVRRDHLLFAPQVHNQGLATSVSIMVKPMGQKGRALPSQVAGGYTSGRRAGGGAGAQAHFPGDPEGEEAGRVAAIHC